MLRTLSCLTLLLAAVPAAPAQTRQPGEPIPLALHPAALPVPASKYRLLPEDRDPVPGNAAALYYRSFAPLIDNTTLFDEVKGGQWELWDSMPPKDLPRDEVRNHLEIVRPMLSQLDEAARCRQCDWQLEGRSEGIGLLLPEIQTLRQVARVLAVRVRFEIAEGHDDEAVRDLQTGYALGRNLGRNVPSLIHMLVGAAVTAVMDQELEALLQEPEAPNLYWALTVLPRPYFDPRPIIDADRDLLEQSWPDLKRLEEGPMTPAQVQSVREQIRGFWRSLGVVPPSLLDLASQAWQQARAYDDARKELLAQGLKAEDVEAMPLFQVVALAALRDYRQARDDYTQWVHVPGFEHRPGYARDRERLKEAGDRLGRLVIYPRPAQPPFDILSPVPYEKIYAAADRTDRRFALLRCVEAIRLYAAGHDGRLPATLNDVTELPIPRDPVNGLPFEYKVQGDRASLAVPVPPGEKLPPGSPSYDLTVAR